MIYFQALPQPWPLMPRPLPIQDHRFTLMWSFVPILQLMPLAGCTVIGSLRPGISMAALCWPTR